MFKQILETDEEFRGHINVLRAEVKAFSEKLPMPGLSI